jgi:amino acid adenylation domain-containing protein
LFDESSVERFLNAYEILLEAASANPDAKISELPIAPQSEIDAIVHEWNSTTREYPRESTLGALFTQQVERLPEKTALEFGDSRLTYRELNARANRLAWVLREKGVGPEVMVGLCAERSFEMIIASLAIIKAGGAYVPLDAEYPRARLDYMLNDTRAPIVLAQPHLIALLPETNARIIPLEPGNADIEHDDSDFDSGATADSLAYVMYTSGSTGSPKGVCITHRNIVRLVKNCGYAKMEDETFFQFAPIGFDAATFEIWGPLLNGGRLVIQAPGRASLEELGAAIRDHGVTTLWLTSGLFTQMVEQRLDSLRELRQLLSGGDVLSPSHVRRVLETMPDLALINGYGPTECTTFACCHPMQGLNNPAFTASSIPIGRPIGNTRAYILDENRRPVPIGVWGELYIGGDGVSRGYLNNPKLSSERFLHDPFAAAPDARMYKTGDITRWTQAGVIEFKGRTDFQVKLRGFRIELGEIETLLNNDDSVGESIAMIREDTPGDKRLVVYITPRPNAEIDVARLRSLMREQLPAHMTPSAIVQLLAFPLTANGKIDRRALPAPEWESFSTSREIVEPHEGTEQLIADIWREVLKIDRIGALDNFFDLGGHSLLATQVVSRAREALGMSIPLRTLFERPTLADFAEAIDNFSAQGESETRDKSENDAPVHKRSCKKPARLTFAQESLLFLEQFSGGFGTYNVPVLFRLRGKLDASRLRSALTCVIERHEALRMQFVEIEKKSFQRVGPSACFDWVESVASSEQEALLEIEEEAGIPFNLSEGPIVRASLRSVGEEEFLLCVTVHHIVFDGWSLEILLRDLATFYEDRGLSELPITYSDYAEWRRNRPESAQRERDVAFWSDRLKGFQPDLELPLDRPRPATRRFQGGQVSRAMNARLSDKIRAFAKDESATLFVVLLSGWGTLLLRYTEQDDIMTGFPVAGRDRPEFENIIGYFVNTLPLRLDLSGDPKFRELVHKTRANVLECFEHQETPFEAIVEIIQPERNADRSPLFQVMFAFHNNPSPTARFAGVEASVEEMHNAGAKFDLTLAVTEAPDGFRMALEYDADLFEEETASRMLGRYETLLETACCFPDAQLSELPILTNTERELLLEKWNDTARPYPSTMTLGALFTRQAEQSPDAPAVDAAGCTLSYKELNSRANRLARRLQSLGIDADVMVGLCAERGVEMLLATLAIIKAGGAYVPMDPDYPKQRLIHILEETAAPVIITRRELLDKLPKTDAAFIFMEDAEKWSSLSDKEPSSKAVSDSVAYVMFTSGSTGKPKGVCVTHKGIARLVINSDYFQFEPADRTPHLANTSFDAATFEIWGPLLNGGCIVPTPREIALDPKEIASFIRSERLTAMLLTTALFNQIARTAPDSFASMRCVLFGGEQADPQCVRAVMQSTPPKRLLNAYGPTEATVIATCHEFKRAPEGTETIPIGRPIANTTVFALDRHQQPVPIGAPGELYIGGDGLARGYLNSPEMTSERFVFPAFPEARGARLYKTGDRVRFLPSGVLEFIGRVDSQVKLRGFRIELGEIETALNRCDGVVESLVIVQEDTPGDKRLIAYIAKTKDGSPDARNLREALLKNLPSHMIPSAFVIMDAFPLNPNGKIDRRALPAPEREAFVVSDAFVAPRTDTERKLAEIWREILNLKQVGIADNFFDIGGHSLLTARIVARMSEVFGASIPLRAIFENQTIAELAARVDRLLSKEAAPSPCPDPCVVMLQSEGDGTPFFCATGAGTVAGYYGPLASCFAGVRPFYGLQDPRLDNEGTSFPTVQELAGRFIQAIRSVQPHGPYFLGGWSFGGIVAFEMASQLVSQGDRIAFLGMIDTGAPQKHETRNTTRGNITTSFRKSLRWTRIVTTMPGLVIEYAKDATRLSIEAVMGKRDSALAHLKPADYFRWGLHDLSTQYNLTTAGLGDSSSRKNRLMLIHEPFVWHVFKTTQARGKAIENYMASKYPGKLTLLRAEHGLSGLYGDDSTLGWEGVPDQGVDVKVIPGNHTVVLRKPYVDKLARELLDHIAAAEKNLEAT